MILDQYILSRLVFSTPVNLTDCAFSLTSSVSGSSVTYTASSFLLGITNFTEETDITKTSLSLSLSGADQTFISTVLSENITNDEVTVFRGLLADDNTLIADPFLLYKGTLKVLIFKNQKDQVQLV